MRRILTAVAGAGVVALAGLVVAVPAQAATGAGHVVQSLGWKKIGTFDTYTCFQKANWYHDYGGTRAERCDQASPGYSTLWVLIDD
ncbi:hypothetical protein ABZS29_11155 [Kribbella sp. NPDC005582]|uniref:hypothetical protein n=1 Tax=Kribbella sp. NPDC005582 TaxID=3156893 RepID=UPI00339E97FA